MKVPLLFSEKLFERRFLHIVYNGKVYDGSVQELIFNPALFETLKIASYVGGSSNFFASLIKGFKRVDVVFGIEEGMASVLLNPEKTLELLKNDILREMILNDSLKARIVTDVVMHSKIYLAEGKLRRVAVGSVNLTQNALLAGQYEELLVFDDEELYEIYLRRFEEIWETGVEFVSEERKKELRAIEFNLNVNATPEEKEDGFSLFALNASLDRLNQALAKAQKVNVNLTGENFLEQIREEHVQAQSAVEKEKRLAKVVQELIDSIKFREKKFVFDKNKVVEKLKVELVEIVHKKPAKSKVLPDRKVLIYQKGSFFEMFTEESGREVEVEVQPEIIKQEIQKIENFLNFYTFFTSKRDVKQAQKGFEVVLYSFASPLMWFLRKKVRDSLGEENVARIPPFLVIGGHPDSGKSKLLDFVSKLTGSQVYLYKTHIETKGETILQSLFHENNLMPLFVDEIETKFWRSDSAEALVKYVANSYVEPHPCLIGASNVLREQVVKPEIVKRMYFINFSNPIPKDITHEAIEYYKTQVGEVDDYLFKVFLTFYKKRILDLDDIDAVLLYDPLLIARNVFKELYRMSDKEVPSIFPEKTFRDEFYEPEKWRLIFEKNKKAFELCKDPNTEELLYAIDLTKIFTNETQRKVFTSRLPSHIVRMEADRLYVSKEEFENFIRANLRRGVFKWIKKVFKV